MTNLQKDYIQENRLKASMVDMATCLSISYNKVRNYMINNNLQTTKKELEQIKTIKRSKKKAWDWDALV